MNSNLGKFNVGLSQALMMPSKDLVAIQANSKKRKEPPQSSANGSKQNEKGRTPKRVKTQNARIILTQTSDAALSNGELDLQAFLKSREFEIKALEDGMRRSKSGLNARAFQQVPRDLRRRTASHNVKRVPRRLQKRAGREMREDNTPTVIAKKRKPGSSRGRLRAETAKKLDILSKKKKLAKAKAMTAEGSDIKTIRQGVTGRTPVPKVKKGLSTPPRPSSKFRKRQIHKSWLPTHIYHAKRAKMTDPKKPLWRLAIPLTPTEKSYRPSHRAGNARGALCWDMSYMSTIGLEGSSISLEKVLRAVGISQDDLWGKAGKKWRDGKRTWSGWLSRGESSQCKYVGPATVIWCHSATFTADEIPKESTESSSNSKKPSLRQIFIRVHPSAFLDLWNELLRLSKSQRPVVHVEDLRFEIGSIDVTGPGSTEALLGTLHPSNPSTENVKDGHVTTFNALRGVTNAASLPSNALLTLSVLDPRLRYPPRKVKVPSHSDDHAAFSLLEMLATWPADESPPSPCLFDRSSRIKATHLPSQKSINRRKGLMPPGEYPSTSSVDQLIPILLFVSRTTSSSSQGTWTLLAPWKCILPIWYCLVHYPLSSGSNPRFGGLQELQQMHFEHGKPWFPADYPGTEAGWAWELDERQRRKEEWVRRPKGKRIEFESLDLGSGRKGEIGLGWACDFERLRKPINVEKEQEGSEIAEKDISDKEAKSKPTPPPFQYLPSTKLNSIISNPQLDVPPTSLITVRITLFSRGVPLACARIYRLPQHPTPSNAQEDSTFDLKTKETTVKYNAAKTGLTTATSIRDQWLSLVPSTNAKSPKPLPTRSVPLSSLPPGSARHRALAQTLLQTPPLPYPSTPKATPSSYPPVPDAEDLIGFVTTGNFNLAEGKGTAFGSLVCEKVLEGLKARRNEKENGGGGGGGLRREERFCIIRNAGESVGRLGIWEAV